MRSLTIRWRLTLWYGSVLGASLAAFAAVVFAAFAGTVLRELDRALAEELSELAAAVESVTDQAQLPARLQRDFQWHEFYEIEVSTAQGEVVFQTPRLRGQRLPADAGTTPASLSADIPGLGAYRIASKVVRAPSGTYVIRAADSLQFYHRELRQLLLILLAAVPIVLGAALAGGYWLSQRALEPVDEVTQAALDISASRLGHRVAVTHPGDELGRLAGAFNGMIARLESSFNEMRRFTADAAHELRTPLAVLRNEAEVALRGNRSAEDYRQALENQLEEIGRLTRLAEELLFLSREDSHQQLLSSQPLRVDRLLGQLVSQLQTAAQAREVTLEIAGLAPAAVHSDADRLRRLFFNLLDNALKYTPPGGRIGVACAARDGRTFITIDDTGIGIPARHLPHVCERFYRVDTTRSSEGTGLGLAICRAIVEADGGTLEIASPSGGGTRVTVSFTLVESPKTEGRAGSANANVSGSVSASGDGVWVETLDRMADRKSAAEIPSIVSR